MGGEAAAPHHARFQEEDGTIAAMRAYIRANVFCCCSFGIVVSLKLSRTVTFKPPYGEMACLLLLFEKRKWDV